MKHCQYCNQQRELRPYGEQGQLICFDCAMSPANKSAAERMFELQSAACGDVAIIGEECGPRPACGEPML